MYITDFFSVQKTALNLILIIKVRVFKIKSINYLQTLCIKIDNGF